MCSECGLCLDVCPTDTLGYSREFDQAGYGRNDFLYDLLIPYREREETVRNTLRTAEAEAAAAKKTAAAAKAAAKKAATETATETADNGDETPTGDGDDS